MKKIFVINGGQKIAGRGGTFNDTLVSIDEKFFLPEKGFSIQVTDINNNYVPDQEVKKYVWADLIIYHFPIWWFALPHHLKQYIDTVFSAGHRKGMFHSDGRKASDPNVGYGTGGTLHGRKYMVSTSWNSPETAFTLPGEFFNQTNEDDGVLFGFHRMNSFLGLEPIKSIHFHDLEKNVTQERIDDYKRLYECHLQNYIGS